jgi:hypothetical protein
MEPFKMKRDKHFIFETKTRELIVAAHKNPSFLAVRSMLG